VGVDDGRELLLPPCPACPSVLWRRARGILHSLRVLKIRMVSINEELKAAQAAKAAINALSTATRKSAVLATLRTANHAAILNLGSGGALNEARTNVGIALSNLMHGLPTPEKINKANSAMDAWIKELEAAKP
jgi:hypothetical protein